MFFAFFVPFCIFAFIAFTGGINVFKIIHSRRRDSGAFEPLSLALLLTGLGSCLMVREIWIAKKNYNICCRDAESKKDKDHPHDNAVR